MGTVDWKPKKKPAPTVEPLPHGGYVLGEELAARNTAAVRAQYGHLLEKSQERLTLFQG